MMARISQVETGDGISWHVEQSGSGPHLMLIPSGEGDCSSHDKVVAFLSTTFTITTFDLPGFSRSIAPPSAMENVTPLVIAKQIIPLMDRLEIPSASIYGSSSGGLIGRALLVHYPQRVERLMIHEVPLSIPPGFEIITQLVETDVRQVIAICQNIFSNVMNENQEAWEALGPEYHKRLEKNYVTWIRKYVESLPFTEWNKDEIMSKPVFWTVGALSTMGPWFDNVVTACEAGITIGMLPCRHFPQVSIPEKMAEYIRGCCQ
ncbi:alpha/beta-hydrolase [Hyaloscypha variabilis F]|uniref:Alpha/beta-hydrolase n=1 Tax=Hyaloscypha variabilis (strain UAMH 11265 / GT02V1 / F) TaxID=1149755 RepID=A0A2J6RSU8_HYAVF|nr:alpha/beta-hydrolase [Hyaloscypha variabilis F]